MISKFALNWQGFIFISPINWGLLLTLTNNHLFSIFLAWNLKSDLLMHKKRLKDSHILYLPPKADQLWYCIWDMGLSSAGFSLHNLLEVSQEAPRAYYMTLLSSGLCTMGSWQLQWLSQQFGFSITAHPLRVGFRNHSISQCCVIMVRFTYDHAPTSLVSSIKL